MNVYDFDGTIYHGDSSLDFFMFMLRKKPIIIKYLFKIARGSLLYVFKKIDKKALKEYFFSFLFIVDGQKYVKLFWLEHKDHICEWYRNQQQKDDVIISASPEFLLAPICKELDIRHLIASDVDIHTGLFRSPNCKGEEKVHLLLEKFPNCHIEKFYSDSISDTPLALMADKAFYVDNKGIKKWGFTKAKTSTNICSAIYEFLLNHLMILKYLLFGTLTTLINLFSYILLYNKFGISNVISTITAWFFAVIFAFFTNKIFVFNSKSFNRRTFFYEILGFLGARIATGFIDIIIMYLTVDILSLNSSLWKSISNIIVIILNYIASKKYIFKKHN